MENGPPLILCALHLLGSTLVAVVISRFVINHVQLLICRAGQAVNNRRHNRSCQFIFITTEGRQGWAAGAERQRRQLVGVAIQLLQLAACRQVKAGNLVVVTLEDLQFLTISSQFSNTVAAAIQMLQLSVATHVKRSQLIVAAVKVLQRGIIA